MRLSMDREVYRRHGYLADMKSSQWQGFYNSHSCASYSLRFTLRSTAIHYQFDSTPLPLSYGSSILSYAVFLNSKVAIEG
jgi:hypothetical protein